MEFRNDLIRDFGEAGFVGKTLRNPDVLYLGQGFCHIRAGLKAAGDEGAAAQRQAWRR